MCMDDKLFCLMSRTYGQCTFDHINRMITMNVIILSGFHRYKNRTKNHFLE